MCLYLNLLSSYDPKLYNLSTKNYNTKLLKHYLNHIPLQQMLKFFRKLFINLLLSSIFSFMTCIHDTSSTGEVDLPTVVMIRNYGYTAEIHKVYTQDGYILELHRIPNSQKGMMYTRNYPVLIPNCLLGSSADYVIAGPERSLPMQLADDGFDVWLANNRGNKYCREHEWLSIETYAFWNFSLQELGVYDLPATTDYILKMTNTDQLHYIGFSLSTTTFFIFASEKPEYQKKIRSHISLAPVANIRNTKSIFKNVAKFAKQIDDFFRLTAHGEFLPYSDIMRSVAVNLCKESFSQKFVCAKMIIDKAFGKDPYYFDQKLLPLLVGHYPSGTSSKLVAHYSQFITTDRFGQYDYGYDNTNSPPSYNLSSIQVPITIFYGENDLLANPIDVEKLVHQLPNVRNVIKVDNKYFNHIDFLFSKNVAKEINNPVKQILQNADEENWN